MINANTKQSYFNNTKLANSLSLIPTTDGTLEVHEFGKYGKMNNVFTMVTLDSDEFDLSRKNISRFEIAVLDTVYTMYMHGITTFSVEMLANALIQKEMKFSTITPNGREKAIKLITQRNKTEDEIDKLSYYEQLHYILTKLSLIRISIDCSLIQQRLGKEMIEEAEAFGYLLPIEGVVQISKVKKNKITKYHFIKKPLLYEYAEKLGRIISVPSEIMKIPNLRNTTLNITMKQEIIKTIAIMKNKNNHYSSQDITYEWKDSDGNSKGLFSRIGLSPSDYKREDNWRKKKSHVHKDAGIILESLKEKGFIVDYHENKSGKAITGYHIEF